MICYFLSFHVLGSRPTVGLSDSGRLFGLLDRLDTGLRWAWLSHPSTLLVLAFWATLVVFDLTLLLKSDLGLLLRSVGVNPRLIFSMGRGLF